MKLMGRLYRIDKVGANRGDSGCPDLFMVDQPFNGIGNLPKAGIGGFSHIHVTLNTILEACLNWFPAKAPEDETQGIKIRIECETYNKIK